MCVISLLLIIISKLLFEIFDLHDDNISLHDGNKGLHVHGCHGPIGTSAWFFPFTTDYFTVLNSTYPDKQDGAKKDKACSGNFNTPVQKKDRG